MVPAQASIRERSLPVDERALEVLALR